MSSAGAEFPDSEDSSFETMKRVFLDSEDLEAFARDVMRLPPNSRFTNSWEEFEEQLNPMFSNLIDMSGADREFLVEFFRIYKGHLDRLQTDTLRKSRVSQSPEDYLITAVFLGEFRDIVEKIPTLLEDIDRVKQLFSCYIALFARLILIEKEDGWEISDAVIDDIGYTRYYSQRAIGQTPEQDPEEVDPDTLRAEVLKQASALAYEKIEISAQDAAELANLSAYEVVEEINLYEIPNFTISPNLAERLNRAAIKDGASVSQIINRILESQLPPHPQQEFDIDKNDPFFLARERALTSFSGEGPETDASELDEILYDPSE